MHNRGRIITKLYPSITLTFDIRSFTHQPHHHLPHISNQHHKPLISINPKPRSLQTREMAAAPPAEFDASRSPKKRTDSQGQQDQDQNQKGRFDLLSPSSSAPLDKILWSLTVPLHITHASQPTTPPFITSVPRFGYLALLLPRLAAYYGADSPCSSFHYEGVQLRNLAVGLLADLYQPPSLPWKLTVGDGPEWDIRDTFMNSTKEVRLFHLI